jgi:hypothetical protein
VYQFKEQLGRGEIYRIMYGRRQKNSRVEMGWNISILPYESQMATKREPDVWG